MITYVNTETGEGTEDIKKAIKWQTKDKVDVDVYERINGVLQKTCIKANEQNSKFLLA